MKPVSFSDALVVTDLDHTFSVGEHIPAAHVDAVARLRSEGVEVIAATGRRHRSAAAMLASHSLAMPIISVNGAAIHNSAGVRTASSPFEPCDAAAVVEAFAELGLAPICVIDDIDNPGVDVWTMAPPMRWSQWADGDPSIRLHDPTTHDWTSNEVRLHVIVAAGDVAAAGRAKARLDGVAAVVATVDGSGEAFVDATAIGVSKWSGVMALYPAGRAVTIAVGDGGNDVDMLEAADIAVVVRNSAAAHLVDADFTIDPVGEHGWCELPDIVLQVQAA